MVRVCVGGPGGAVDSQRLRKALTRALTQTVR